MKKNLTGWILGIYIASMVLLYAFQIVLILLINFNYVNLDLNDDSVLLRLSSVSNLSYYGIIAIAFLTLFRVFWKEEALQFRTEYRKHLLIISLGFLVMIVTSLVMSLIYEFFGITDTSENQAQLNALLQGGWFDQLSLVVFAVFLAPLVEEMVFRYAGFKLLKKINNIPGWLVVLLSSVVFGLIHVTAGDMVQVYYYIGLGLVLGAIYYFSDNILTPILVHMLLNGFVTITMFL